MLAGTGRCCKQLYRKKKIMGKGTGTGDQKTSYGSAEEGKKGIGRVVD